MVESRSGRKRWCVGIPGFVFLDHLPYSHRMWGQTGAGIQLARRMPTSSRTGLRKPTRRPLRFNPPAPPRRGSMRVAMSAGFASVPAIVPNPSSCRRRLAVSGLAMNTDSPSNVSCAVVIHWSGDQAQRSKSARVSVGALRSRTSAKARANQSLRIPTHPRECV